MCAPLTSEDLGDELCEWCPLEPNQRGSHLLGGGFHSCEGSCCDDAYDNYVGGFNA